MNKFNLSDWALEHRSLVWYFMIIFVVAGTYAYLALGREEDPSFTIKTMVIQAQWPGASAQEVTEQVTDRIEKKLQELSNLEHTRSITTAGQTIVFVDLLPGTNAQDVKPTWSRVRNLIDDIQHEFPQGVVGPFFDDQFGDVYGNIYAFTSDGLSHRELRDFAEDARTQILEDSRRGQGRRRRCAGRGHLSRILHPQDRCPRHQSRRHHRHAAGAERRHPVRLYPDRAGTRCTARRRAVHLRRDLAWDQPQGKRSLLSADRRRHHHPRLCRSSEIALPLQWKPRSGWRSV